MKKTLKLCSLLLATVMLASLCACSAQEESHPSDEMMPLAPTQVSDRFCYRGNGTSNRNDYR